MTNVSSGACEFTVMETNFNYFFETAFASSLPVSLKC